MANRTNTAVWMENQNRWQINVQKDGIRRSFTSSTPGRAGQREANAKADAWLDNDIVAGKRVSELWEIYLESVKISSGTANYKKAVSMGVNYILPTIGHLKIEKVTENHLQNIIDNAYKNGSLAKDKAPHSKSLKDGETLSRKTLSSILTTIRSFFKFCRVRLRCTTLNPESLAIPSGARYKGKNILQPDSLATLYSCDTTKFRQKIIFDRFIYAYRFIVSSGLRPGEAIGLKIGDFKDGKVTISRSINIYGEETKGKNHNAVRSFYLPPLARESFEAQLAYLKGDNVSLFPSTPLFQIDNEQQLYKAWKRYCTANGIPFISLYEMRHTFVSISKQLPEGTVKALVGHSQNMDTFGVYGHQITGEGKETAEAVGRLFERALNTK